MTAAGLHLFLRTTARISALLFLPAFAMKPENPRRNGLLAAFGVSHGLHLVGIVVLAAYFWPEFAREFPPPVLAGGTALLACVFFAAANGVSGLLRHQSLASARTVATAEYLVWALFQIEFAGHSFRAPLLYAPFVTLAGAALLLRLRARRTRPVKALAASSTV